MLIKIVTAFSLYFIYWFCCFLATGTDKKNLAGLRSYPDAVQKAVREHPSLGKEAPKEKPILSVLIGNIILFTVIFSILGLAMKNILALNSFLTAFIFFLALGEGLGTFDLMVIDLLWGAALSAYAFPFCKKKRPIKTQVSILIHSCVISQCLQL